MDMSNIQHVQFDCKEPYEHCMVYFTTLDNVTDVDRFLQHSNIVPQVCYIQNDDIFIRIGDKFAPLSLVSRYFKLQSGLNCFEVTGALITRQPYIKSGAGVCIKQLFIEPPTIPSFDKNQPYETTYVLFSKTETSLELSKILKKIGRRKCEIKCVVQNGIYYLVDERVTKVPLLELASEYWVKHGIYCYEVKPWFLCDPVTSGMNMDKTTVIKQLYGGYDATDR